MTNPDIVLTPEQEEIANKATEEASVLRRKIADVFVAEKASKVGGLSALAGMLIVNTLKFTTTSKEEFLSSLGEFWDEEEAGMKEIGALSNRSSVNDLLDRIRAAIEDAGLQVSGVEVVTSDQLRSIGIDPDKDGAAPAVVQPTQSE